MNGWAKGSMRNQVLLSLKKNKKAGRDTGKRERGGKKAQEGSLTEKKAKRQRFGKGTGRPFTFGDYCIHVIIYLLNSFKIFTENLPGPWYCARRTVPCLLPWKYRVPVLLNPTDPAPEKGSHHPGCSWQHQTLLTPAVFNTLSYLGSGLHRCPSAFWPHLLNLSLALLWLCVP